MRENGSCITVSSHLLRPPPPFQNWQLVYVSSNHLVHANKVHVDHFRLTKLVGLLLKTLAKPLSKRIKHEFSRYPFSQKILIGIGQASHQATSRMTIWSSGYKVRSITPLEDDKAMATGAEFVGEGFILLVSSGVVIYEYNRSNIAAAEKERKKYAKAKAERDALNASLKALDKRLEKLEKAVHANSHQIALAASQQSAAAKQPVRSKWGIFGI